MRTWYGTLIGHVGHELDGIQWGLNGDKGDISPVDIGYEMDPMLAKWNMQRAQTAHDNS
jgi:hypothetical protein